jgi:hypothetical protein
MTISKEEKIEIFENAISWVVVFAMFVYGAAKVIQFDGGAEVDKYVSEMTGMELMWAFYGYSKPFAIILGLLEITGGILILIRRTRVLGCLLTSTILINIILQDVFYQVNIGALIAAIIYQILIFIILWMNRIKLVESIKALIGRRKHNRYRKNLWRNLIIAFSLFALLRVAEYFITHW